MDFYTHFIEILNNAKLEKLIGYFYMFGLIGYLMYLAISHRNDFWDAIKGENGRLEMPEIIMAFVLIVYINIAIVDTFLGLVPSDGVFWSLNGIIMYSLTHRIFSPKKGGALIPDDETEIINNLQDSAKNAGLNINKDQIKEGLDKVKDAIKDIADQK